VSFRLPSVTWVRALAVRMAFGAMMFLSSSAGNAADLRLLETIGSLGGGSGLTRDERLNRYSKEQRDTATVPFSSIGHLPLASESAPRRLSISEAHRVRVVGPNQTETDRSHSVAAAVTLPAVRELAPRASEVRQPTSSRPAGSPFALSGARTARFFAAGC